MGRTDPGVVGSQACEILAALFKKKNIILLTQK